jgi:RNA polymerase primary sigma factor
MTMNEARIERAVEVLADDYVRQSSHLDSAQVERTFDRRGLNAEERSEALGRLDTLGVHVDSGRVVGYEAMHAVRSPAPYSRHIDVGLDPVRLYLKDIGKERLLAPDDEVLLARRIKAGNEARTQLIEHGSTLSSDYTARLKTEIRDGDAAFQRMLVANLRLVVSIAKRYQNQSASLDFLDLVQEGTIGLRRAVQKFDHTRGFKFSTYATWWIRQAITRAIADKGRTIRIPVHAVEDLAKIQRASRYLESTLGETPKLDVVAAYVEMPMGKVQALLDMAREPISLDAPITLNSSDEEAGDLEDVLDVPSIFGDPAELGEQLVERETVHNALSRLTARERQVIELRFALTSDSTRTLEEIGQLFGLTRERIRQIEGIALGRLRGARGMRALRDEYWPPRTKLVNKDSKTKVDTVDTDSHREADEE